MIYGDSHAYPIGGEQQNGRSGEEQNGEEVEASLQHRT
jgi:hypothetical protein